MVFESLLAYFIDKYLSDYIENIDTSKLSVGIWSGDVVLENLNLKSNALDELDLPVTIVHGHLKKLTLRIPWKSLYTQSVKANIEGLTILIAPKSSINYDPEKEKKQNYEKKMNEVRRLLEMEKANEKIASQKDANQQDTFTERLQMQIMRNIEVQIHDLHVRFEDNYSKPEHPFSIGFTLKGIEIETADENWNPTYLKENKTIYNKLVLLDSFSIYCNSDDELLYQKPKDTVIASLMDMIANNNKKFKLNYILNPMSISSKVVLNIKPKQDNFQKPMFDIAILLQSVILNLNRLQYFDVVDMLNMIGFMELNARYKKYKPSAITSKNKAKQLWKFAIDAVLETMIKPKFNQFKWDRMSMITRTRKEYTRIYKNKLINGKSTVLELEEERNCEQILDVFNILLARKQAQVAAARKAQEKSGSWLSWGLSKLGYASNTNEANLKVAEVEKLTSEEKEKLYEAIGYTGEESYSEYPVQYVNMIIKFNLNKFEVALIDGEYRSKQKERWISDSKIISLQVENMNLNFERRPVNNGIKVSAEVKNILLMGCSFKNEAHVPVIIEPQSKDKLFIELMYEEMPLDSLCTKRLNLTSNSLKFVYDAITIHNISNFFKSSIKIKRSRVAAAAIKTVVKVKERSLMFMKNNLDKIPQTDINIDIQPSYLLVPESGVLTEKSQLICIDFGHLSLKCKPKDGNKESDDMEEKSIAQSFGLSNISQQDEIDIIKRSYWKFFLCLKHVQITLAKNEQDFNSYRNIADNYKSNNHILTPLDIVLNLHKCAYSDDANLPAMRIFGELPLINFALTDTKLVHILKIFMSIAYNDKYVESERDYHAYEETFDESSPVSLSSHNSEENLVQSIQQLNKMLPSEFEDDDNFSDALSTPIKATNVPQQNIIVDFSFEIKDIILTINEESEQKKYFNKILFRLSSIGAQLRLKSYDIESNVYLNYIILEYDLADSMNSKRLYLINSLANAEKLEIKSNDERLIDIKLVKTDEISPTLSTLHDDCLCTIAIKFRTLNFLLDQTAFGNVLRFVNSLNSALNSYTKTLSHSKSTTAVAVPSKHTVRSKVRRQESTFGQLDPDQINNLLYGQKQKTKSKVDADARQIISLRVTAEIDSIRLSLANLNQDYFQVFVENFSANLVTKQAVTELDLILARINLQDTRVDSIYKNLIKLKEEDKFLIEFNLKFFNKHYLNKKIYLKNYLNIDDFDLVLTGKLAKLQCIFLYQHLSIILNFMNVFKILSNTEPIETLKQNSNENVEIVKKDAKSGAHEHSNEINLDFIYKISLNITIDAPIIIVPQNSKSKNAVLVDCGNIRMGTSLIVQHEYNQQAKVKHNIPPIIERQNIKLLDVKVLRVILNDALEIKNELVLIDSSELSVVINRNLQAEMFKDIVPVEVSVSYDGLSVYLSKQDYTFILTLAQENFSENAPQSVYFETNTNTAQQSSLERMKSIESKQSVSTSKSAELKSDTESYQSLSSHEEPLAFKLLFRVRSIKGHFYTEESALTERMVIRKPETAFSIMELNNLKLTFASYEQPDRFSMSFITDKIYLDDLRLKGPNPLRRLIERRETKEIIEKPMISLSLESEPLLNSKNKIIPKKKLIACISCLKICLSIDYLLVLFDFFVDGLPKDSQVVQENVKSTENQIATQPEEGIFLLECNAENPQLTLVINQLDMDTTDSFTLDAQIKCKLNRKNNDMNLNATLSEFIVKFTSFKLKYEYLILMPTYASIDGFMNNSKQKFDIELQETNINFCPPIMNAIVALTNSVGSIMENFKPSVVTEIKKRAVPPILKVEEFDSEDFWFTKSNQYQVAKVSEPLKTKTASQLESSLLNLKAPALSLKIEADIAEQLPLVCCHFNLNGLMKDFHKTLHADFSMSVQAAYFNEAVAVWEPLIELCDVGDNSLKPWELRLNILEIDEEQNKQKTKKDDLEHLLKTFIPKYIFQLDSFLPLQLVISRTFLNLIDSMTKMFQFDTNENEQKLPRALVRKSPSNDTKLNSDIDHNISMKKLISIDSIDFTNKDEEDSLCSFLIKNELGFDVYLNALGGFRFWNNQKFKSFSSISEETDHSFNYDTIVLENQKFWPIVLTDSMSAFNTLTDERKSLQIALKLKENQTPVTVTFNECRLYGIYVKNPNPKNDDYLIVCETISQFDKKRIYLRSAVQITNHLDIDFEIAFGSEQKQYTCLKPTKKCNVPLEFIKDQEFKIRPIFENNSYEYENLKWIKNFKKTMQFNDIHMQVTIVKEPCTIKSNIDNEEIDFVYNVLLLPIVTLYNNLPYTINFNVGKGKEDLKPGEYKKLLYASVDSCLAIKLENYLNTHWFSTKTIEAEERREQGELQFRSTKGDLMLLGLFYSKQNESINYTLYAPYWILNKTSLNLELKMSGKDDIEEISQEASENPQFLKSNFSAKFNQKANVVLKVKNFSDWSDQFLIDAAGNIGTVICKSKSKHYEIGVDIKLSNNGLTKIITLTPYYVFVNKTELKLEICEQHHNEWVKLEPNSVVPFWPNEHKIDEKRYVVMRYDKSSASSKPFWFNSKHSTALNLASNNPKAVYIECAPTETMIKNVIKEFDYGLATALIINKSKKHAIDIQQNNENDQYVLTPGTRLLYSWDNPIGTREIKWTCGNVHNEMIKNDRFKSNHQFEIRNNEKLHCLEFLDGLQKVIMFVDDLIGISDEIIGIGSTGGNQFLININELGISLVDNLNAIEITYIWFSSNYVLWGELDYNGRFLPFKNDQISEIEDGYKRYEEDNRKNGAKTIGKTDKIDVDFDKMTFHFDDHNGSLIRKIAPSISIDYCQSDKQTTLHFIIHKAQIDNQLENSIFPVVFAKLLPSKSKTSNILNKPLLELSLIQATHSQTKISEIIYFKVLIQEFFVKLDQRIIGTLITLFTNEENKSIGEKQINNAEELNEEIAEIKQTLKDLVFVDKNEKSNLIYFHECQLSPIKIHLSYSMVDYGSESNKLLLKNPYLQSILSTLTDMQDVVFKLGYFEVKNSVHSWASLGDAAIAHYKHQVIRQGYILMLGLDVLGNPFSIIRGISEGMESLFYEPFSGSVQGPGEFIETVGAGITKLFGNAFGGAAGAVSKITGTIGKGIATLSFDKEYQRSRYKPTESGVAAFGNIGQNFAKNVFSGITGVVTKPMEGAKQEGVKGLFTGIGKGLLGVVTKPTGGVIDLASQSLGEIKKVATQEEIFNRVRPPRCIYEDHIVRPYRLKEAQLIQILKELEKGKYAKDRYVAQLELKKDLQYILIATNKRVMLITQHTLFGQYQMEWCFEYKDLTLPPYLSPEGICFIPEKEEKSFFGSKPSEKTIRVTDKKAAEDFVTKVEDAMNRNN